MSFVVVEGRPLFFRFRDGPYFPTLRLLHQCEWQRLIVDRSLADTRLDRQVLTYQRRGLTPSPHCPMRTRCLQTQK